ncbi:unnamed protein product [Urochloa humidicola]
MASKEGEATRERFSFFPSLRTRMLRRGHCQASSERERHSVRPETEQVGNQSNNIAEFTDAVHLSSNGYRHFYYFLCYCFSSPSNYVRQGAPSVRGIDESYETLVLSVA